MINLIFSWLCVLLMILTGIIVCKVFRVNNHLMNHKGVLLLPGIGIIFLINIVQILNLFVPVKWLIYPYLAFVIWGTIKYASAIKVYLKVLTSSKLFIYMILLVSFIWMLPLLERTELTSIQVWNNDIIYYLASMDWLKEHTSLQTVVYDVQHPLYWCAEYMLNRTRTGFDGYGAFMMSLFGLEGHEIFSCMGVVFGITLLFHAYYFLSTVVKIPWKFKVIAVALIAVSGRIDELLIYQYLPQLCGISLLLVFISLIVPFMEENNDYQAGIVAFVMSGIYAVYGEFCAYLLVIYIGTSFIALKKGYKSSLRRGWSAGIVSLLINPVGTWRAIKINLFVLLNIDGGMNNIDPFYGEISSITDIFTQWFGVCRIKNMPQGVEHTGYTIICWLVIFIFIFWAGYYIKCIQDERKPYFLWIVLFLAGYEIYFRSIHYGYGEYKHLISSTVLMLIFGSYAGYMVLCYSTKRILGKILYLAVNGFIFISGSANLYENLIHTEYYYYDKSLMELEEAGRLIPPDETIGISGTPAVIHGAVYALKRYPVYILSNNISYMPYAAEASSRYHLYEGDYKERGRSTNEKFIWGNQRFYLVENTSLQAVYYTGFHLQDYESETDARDTCENESTIMVYNYAEDTKYFSLAFQTEGMNEEQTKIKVMVNGAVAAKGKTGDYIVTDMLMLNPGEAVRIYIYYDGNVNEINGKQVGFRLSGLKLISYDEER